MTENLLIVFVKNIRLGKVKTRLAKTIGNEAAFQVYKELVAITEKATSNLNCDKHIYFSDVIIESIWANSAKFVQEGDDLGERMLKSFQNGFDRGYKNIILIGSDLPSLTSEIINKGFDTLNDAQVVFGPAEDGGYYLVGMSQECPMIFQDKPWSQESLLRETLSELSANNIDVKTIDTLNDIDTFEDLKQYPELLKLVDELC